MHRVLVATTDDAVRFPSSSPASWLTRRLQEIPSWFAESCRSGRIVPAVRSMIARGTSNPHRPVVVVFGAAGPQRRAVWDIVKGGLRPRIFLVLHLRADEVPFAPATAPVLRFADLLVVESSFAARAIHACLRESHAGVAPRVAIIHPATGYATVDDASDPRAPESTAPFRVGCILEPYAERRAFHALRIFRLFADGAYSVCRECRFVTPCDERSEAFETGEPGRCLRCDSDRSLRGCAWPATLHVVAYPAPQAALERPEPWDLHALRSFLGLDGRVHVEGERELPPLTTETAWLDRLSSFDAHLSPYEGAGVDRAALATCLLGVPTLTTRFGATAEVLAGRASLIEPRTRLLESAGHWTPVMDPGTAALELAAVAGKPSRRSARETQPRGEVEEGADSGMAARQWRQELARLGETAL